MLKRKINDMCAIKKNLCHLQYSVVVLLAIPGIAAANCGSAFCSVNTSWDTQTPWNDNTTRLDLRMEFIPQNQLRSGVNKVQRSGELGEHDEIKTYNRNYIANLSHPISPNLALALQVPLVSRNHSHFSNHADGPELESWDFTRLGDVHALLHLRLDNAQSPQSNVYGLTGGIKLPTGSIKVRNASEETAERTLQPGSGTTDLLVGGFASGRIMQANWYTQMRWQHALSERQNYRPGDAVNLDIGISYPMGEIQALAQINLQWRGHDSGTSAESSDSGGRYIYFSPGLAVPIGHDMQVYGLIQLPLLQDVRGTQLTSDWAATLGLTMRF